MFDQTAFEYTRDYEAQALRVKQQRVLYAAMDHLLARYDAGEVLSQVEIEFLEKHFIG